MTIREGVDYSGARPTADALRKAGRDFVVRYARKTGSLNKQITPAEVTYWRANHIDIAIVDEVSAGRMLAGYTAGQTDAAAAAAAIKSVGGPADGGVIHFACDVDTTSDAQRAAVAYYLSGAASVLGWDKVGVYGEWQVIDWVHDHEPVEYLWQTYAWSGGVRHPAATLYQYLNGQVLGGVEVDYCRAYASDFGQWPQEDDVTAKEMWDFQIPFPSWAKDVPHAQPTYSAGEYLADTSVRAAQMLQRETAQDIAIAALAKLVAAPAADLTAEQVEAAVAKAIRENTVSVDVSVHGGSVAAPDQPPASA